jgi:hypothetical protein
MPRRPRKPPNEAITIIRTPKIEKYFTASNALFCDARLSWEARGLMGYLLSKPDNWKVRLYDLVRNGPAGEHKIRRVIRELEQAGYLRRERISRRDGKFDWLTIVCEAPGIYSEFRKYRNQDAQP